MKTILYQSNIEVKDFSFLCERGETVLSYKKIEQDEYSALYEVVLSLVKARKSSRLGS